MHKKPGCISIPAGHFKNKRLKMAFKGNNSQLIKNGYNVYIDIYGVISECPVESSDWNSDCIPNVGDYLSAELMKSITIDCSKKIDEVCKKHNTNLFKITKRIFFKEHSYVINAVKHIEDFNGIQILLCAEPASDMKRKLANKAS